MVYAYQRKDYDVRRDKTRPLSAVFVTDLTQNNRVFSLSPELIVRGAFIYENQFYFFGTLQEDELTFVRSFVHSVPMSLFRYDVATKELINCFGHQQYPIDILHSVNECQTACTIETIQKIGEDWHFSYRIEKSYETGRYYAYMQKEDDGWHLYRDHLGDARDCWMVMIKGNRISCKEFSNEKGQYLYVAPLGEGYGAFVDKGARRYILLGDYLYKSTDSERYKANISQGWDHLQWELMMD